MKPTIRTLAEALELSPATVSKALSGRPEVNENTRTRVLNYAKDLGYIPMAGRLSNTTRVAIIIEDTDNTDINSAFYYDILLGFKQYSKQRGFEDIILSISPEEQELQGYDDFVNARQLDGVFVMGLKTTDLYYRQLSETTIPSVALDILVDNPAVGCVGVDNIAGARLAVEHLISLGHRRIGFLNGHGEAFVSKERLYGYMAAVCSGNLEYDPRLVYEGDYTVNGGMSGADYFAKQGVTAVFCASDLMALGAVRRFHEMGLRIPQDISVVGFDNAPLCTLCEPPLATVAQNRTRIGITACALLDGLMRGVPINHIVLRPEFIIRKSTGALQENI
jgi:DNA-binding LacI/PurR family transcriptional regulator